jgi:hypothetical protein
VARRRAPCGDQHTKDQHTNDKRTDDEYTSDQHTYDQQSDVEYTRYQHTHDQHTHDHDLIHQRTDDADTAIRVSTIAALAAHTLKKPVRIALNRDEDMWATGNRVRVLCDAVLYLPGAM